MGRLFRLATFLSAALLFLLEPMFARMVLPSLGGSPAVWTTALLFYQAALLAAYAYAHVITTYLRPRRQFLLHCLLLIAAAAFLPVQVPPSWSPPADHNPTLAILVLFAGTVGLPFFALAATGPLLQKWLSASRDTSSADPYFLYATSNAGSLIGLLSYPLLIEPHLALGAQSLLWGVGYLAFCLILCLGGVLATSSTGAMNPALARPQETPDASAPEASPNGRRERLLRNGRWLVLTFVPSSLMLGVTTHITTDVAAVPLLWVIPLALYLLSFVLVFGKRPLITSSVAGRVLPFLVLPLLVVILGQPSRPLFFIVGLHVAFFFLAALMCHAQVAETRPPAAELTEFYLCVAVGGTCGGLFNAVLAPHLFHNILEYPLAIAVVCALSPWRVPRADAVGRRLDWILPIFVTTVIFATLLAVRSRDVATTRVWAILAVAVLALPLFAWRRRPLRFGLAIGGILLVTPVVVSKDKGLHAERSFFGVHRVLLDPSARYHLLYNGSTLHGLQRVEPRVSDAPLGYYARSGPLGDVFRVAAAGSRAPSVAVVGLGAGGIAGYAKAGESWTYYELDPAVDRIAHDARLFSYLSRSPSPIRIVLGDARLSLARSNDRYDLMVLDAYSSDAIPVHLLTREALQLYLSHLAPAGWLVFHISNKFLDLAPVVAGLARDAHLACRMRNFVPSDSAAANGELPSVYAVVCRRPSDLGALLEDSRWAPVPLRNGLDLWTDDYSSLFAALRR